MILNKNCQDYIQLELIETTFDFEPVPIVAKVTAKCSAKDSRNHCLGCKTGVFIIEAHLTFKLCYRKYTKTHRKIPIKTTYKCDICGNDSSCHLFIIW